jgi:serine/threonine-protein kinase
VLEDPDAGSLPVPGIGSRAAAKASRRRLAAFILPALAAGALALVALWPRAASEVGPVSRFAIATTAATALDVDPQSGDLALTPDGRHIVYKGGPRDRTQLFVRALDRLEPVALTPPGRPKAPFSSPDGLWIGFFEPGGGGPRLEKVAITGGRPIDVCRIDGASRGASWGADGAIVLATAAPATGLQRIAASSGEPEVLTRPARDRGESDHLWPQILPGGRTVLFTIVAVTGGMDASQIAVLDLPSRTWKTVLRGGRQAQYVSSGHLVYVVGDALWAVPFDLTALETRGPAAMVVDHVLTLPTGTAEFDVTPGGTLLFATGRPLPSRRTLVWVDRRGHAEAIAGAAQRPYAAVRLSPDGSRVALEIGDEDNDIWVWDLARQTMTRVTTDPGLDQGPVWMPDGHRLLFTSQTGGVPGALFRQSADGTGTAAELESTCTAPNEQNVAKESGRHGEIALIIELHRHSYVSKWTCACCRLSWPDALIPTAHVRSCTSISRRINPSNECSPQACVPWPKGPRSRTLRPSSATASRLRGSSSTPTGFSAAASGSKRNAANRSAATLSRL